MKELALLVEGNFKDSKKCTFSMNNWSPVEYAVYGGASAMKEITEPLPLCQEGNFC